MKTRTAQTVSFCALVLALVVAPRARADVLVVARDGSGDYLQINQAVQQAAEGDVLLVKSGLYAPFLVPDKALWIAADEGALVEINGYSAVISLSAGKEVTFSGLRAAAQTEVQFGLYLFDNQGAVRIYDCEFTGFTPAEMDCLDFGMTDPGGSAVYVENCNDVALSACLLRGGGGADSEYYWCLDVGGAGGEGLEVINSRVAIYESTIVGGQGGSSGYSGRGGDGVHLSASAFFVSGQSIQGGDAGVNLDVISLCQTGGTGLFADAGSQARVLDCAVSGGQKDFFDGCGQDGPAYGGPGVFVFYAREAASLHAPRAAREDSSLSVQIQGTPGDSVRLFSSAWSQQRHLTAFQSSILLAPPLCWTLLPGGTLDANGSLTMQIPIGQLGLALPARALNLQALLTDPAGNSVLSSAAHTIVLDSAF